MCNVDTATKVGQYSPPKSSEPKSTTQEPAPPTQVAGESGGEKGKGVEQAKSGVAGAQGADASGSGGASSAVAGVSEMMPNLVEVLTKLVEVLKSLVEALMDSVTGGGDVGGKSGGKDVGQDPGQDDSDVGGDSGKGVDQNPLQCPPKDKGTDVGGDAGDEDPAPPPVDEDPKQTDGKDGKTDVGGDAGDEDPAPPPADEDPKQTDGKGGKTDVGGDSGDEDPAPPPADEDPKQDPVQQNPIQTDVKGKEGPATGSVLLEDWDDKKSGGAIGSKGVALTGEDGYKLVIWGDPHVEIHEPGAKKPQKFDIGYGTGFVELSTGTVVRWDTSTKKENGADHIMRNIWIEQAGGESFEASTYDGTSHVGEKGQVTTMTDAELREFAAALCEGKGAWKEPLHASLADALSGVHELEPSAGQAAA